MIKYTFDGHVMILDRETSDDYVFDDESTLDEVNRDASILAQSIGGMVEVRLTPPEGSKSTATLLACEVWP